MICQHILLKTFFNERKFILGARLNGYMHDLFVNTLYVV